MIIFKRPNQTMALKTRILTSVFFLTSVLANAQNRLNLQMEGGEPFKVLIEDREVNATPETNVIVNDVVRDTLLIKVELESGLRYGVTLFLLDKGKRTSRKEFNYLLRKEKNRLRPVFMGMYFLK